MSDVFVKSKTRDIPRTVKLDARDEPERCSCPGWHYRHECAHVRYAAKIDWQATL